ncbi:gamma-soluble NSF attachment protein-like [Gigantopelta aegis]|uniref:gamma-soluble NSF attachment protein-like n=1 Tax=Gigantopelta aegis TaxID=1735272 RepID=UPI001B88D053|nr:gamma-soluble NSF attachment protein-like [Gigantopelta aegis]
MASNFHGKEHTFVDRKLCEGLEHLRLADKCLKTSFFKWKPDVDGACEEYQQAATSFKNAKAYDEAKETLIKLANLQKENSPFHAAKSYEQAGLILKEAKQYEEAVYLMEKAALLFQEDGTPDSASLTLEKAAKMVELDFPEKASQLYIKACEVAEIEDKPGKCAEYIGKAARLMTRLRRYDDAAEYFKKEVNYHLEAENYGLLNKVVLGLVLVHLHREDYVAAELVFKSSLSYPDFGASEEAAAVENLLSAYDEGDEEAARQTLSLPLIKYMDNAFARMARDLVIPGGVSTSKSDVKNTGPADEEDEFPDGLL